MEKVETGRVFYRDEEGKLHLAVSYCDGMGNVTTEENMSDDETEADLNKTASV